MEHNINNTTTTSLNDLSPSFLTGYSIDTLSGGKNTFVYFKDANQNFRYYKNDPQIKKSIDALASWTVGRGYTIDSTYDKVVLESLDGWGEDTIDSILWNMIVVKKIVGDSFAEIIRADNKNPKSQLINLKPISPERMRIELNEKGRILKYQTFNKNVWQDLPKERVLHLCNDRTADEPHGVSVIDACKWAIDAKREAMEDWKRISHRSTIRVLYVDMNNASKINQLKEQYKDGIKNGEVLILPAKKSEAEFEDLQLPPIDAFLNWISYLDNQIYVQLGIPKIILGGADQVSEGSNKMSSYNFEQVYMAEQRLLEQDIWSQLFIKIHFERPKSLMDNLASNEAKNTSQTSFQAKDFSIAEGRE
jgi:hypothetical protein